MATTANLGVDVNNTQCLVSKPHIGYDTLINICSGKSIDITWTNVEWGMFIFIAAFLVLGGLLVIYMLYDTIWAY